MLEALIIYYCVGLILVTDVLKARGDTEPEARLRANSPTRFWMCMLVFVPLWVLPGVIILFIEKVLGK